jgi:hypothetical protein
MMIHPDLIALWRKEQQPARYRKVPASLVMAEIELPDFRTMLVNCSPDNFRRLRSTLTCTLSFKSSEFRKKVGLRLIM